jgi:membrane protein implicated in regulation of membrane protease activity
MKTLFNLVLAFLVLYLCGVAGSFFGGVVGAIAAAAFHAGPYAITLIVRVVSSVFFLGFVALALAIYLRRQSRRTQQKNSASWTRRGFTPPILLTFPVSRFGTLPHGS